MTDEKQMAEEKLVDLFPILPARLTGQLQVSAVHSLYWEESGNPQGLPVVFLHGGPGGGTAPTYRRFFSPERYRIILFDQRGAGKSTPNGEISDNHTDALISDIEALREHLGIGQWLVFGGSWGSTLALAYGEAHPQRCLGFILRGVFLFRRSETDWFLQGMRMFFPQAWRRFQEFLPPEERPTLLASYYRRLTDPDPARHLPAAKAWCLYEDSCSRLMPHDMEVSGPASPGQLAMARIEAHYMVHDGFLPEGSLLDNLPRIAGLPAIIVQGRYDTVCPMVSADELARLWPIAEFVIVEAAGHSSLEPGIRTALVEATERIARRLRPTFEPPFSPHPSA